MNNKEKYEFAIENLKTFNNYLEIKDFRHFLLLILNLKHGGPEAMLRKLGLGGSQGKIILPYDSDKHAYYTKIISGTSMNQLTIYFKSDKIHSNFLNRSDSKILKENLTKNERENLLPKKFVLLIPEVIDHSKTILSEKNTPKTLISGIESFYSNLGEFIAAQTLKFLFLIENEKADLLYNMNISFDPKHNSENSIQYFDVYIDGEKKLRDFSFIQMKNNDMKEGNLKMNYLKEITDFSHSDRFDSHYTIIVPVKSFKKL